jgi:hypothetical protein
MAGLKICWKRRTTRVVFAWVVIMIAGMTSACSSTASLTPTPPATETPVPSPTSAAPTSTPSPTATPGASPTIEPTGSPEPAITVVAPNGGEVWKEGRTYRIRWRATGVEQVNIEAASGGKDLGHIAFEVGADTASYAWTIPEGFVSGFGGGGSDTMRIRIYAVDDTEVADENDAHFTIEAP